MNEELNEELWVGKICVFWNEIGDKPELGLLGSIEEGLYLLNVPRYGSWFKNCRPLTIEEARSIII